MSDLEQLLTELPGVVLRHIPANRYMVIETRHFDASKGDIVVRLPGWKRDMVKRPESGANDNKWLAQLQNNALSSVRFTPERYALGDTPLQALQALKAKIKTV